MMIVVISFLYFCFTILLIVTTTTTTATATIGKEQQRNQQKRRRIKNNNNKQDTNNLNGQFILLSDVHYDPLYGTSQAYKHLMDAPCTSDSDAPPYSAYGCGSSELLVESVFANAVRLLDKPDFILFLGDATRHGTSTIEPTASKTNITDMIIKETIGLIPKLTTKYYGTNNGIPIISMPPMNLGNNDFMDDYTLDVTSEEPCYVSQDEQGNLQLPQSTNIWLNDISNTYKDMFASEEERNIFACGGYISRQITPKLNVIVLNTVLWSNKLNSDYSITKIDITNPNVDPFGQHVWLSTTLSHLQDLGSKVYIIGHIPPVLESYTHNVGESMMYEWHVIKYYNTIQRYSNIIAGQFFGHIHTSELRSSPTQPIIPPTNSDYDGETINYYNDLSPGASTTIDNNNDIPPILTTGSISPCYNSNPVFNIVTYDYLHTQHIQDVTTYVARLDLLNKENYRTFQIEMPVDDTNDDDNNNNDRQMREEEGDDVDNSNANNNGEEEEINNEESDTNSDTPDDTGAVEPNNNKDDDEDQNIDETNATTTTTPSSSSFESTSTTTTLTLIEFEPEFDSLVSFLIMKDDEDTFANTNNNKEESVSFLNSSPLSSSNQIKQLASQLLIDNELWDRYGNQWHKGLVERIQQNECSFVGSGCRLKQSCIMACGSTEQYYKDCLDAAAASTITTTTSASTTTETSEISSISTTNVDDNTTVIDNSTSPEEVQPPVPPPPISTLYQCTLSEEAYEVYREASSMMETAIDDASILLLNHPAIIFAIIVLSLIVCTWCYCYLRYFRKRSMIRRGMTRINEVYLEEFDFNNNDGTNNFDDDDHDQDSAVSSNDIRLNTPRSTRRSNWTNTTTIVPTTSPGRTTSSTKKTVNTGTSKIPNEII